jgi:hypothetical protein
MEQEKNFLIESGNIKALSWKEPYGSLMLAGKIETRTWYTNYRGWVLICTSKKSYNLDQILDISGQRQFNRIIDFFENKDHILNPGHAIAVAWLENCRLMQPADEDDCYVKHSYSLYCHIYTDILPIVPYPVKGKQGFFKVPEEIIQILVKNIQSQNER